MRRNNFVQILSFIFRIVLGIVFLYAAIGKIDNPAAFYKEIVNYNLFPNLLSQVFAIIIPWIELAIGIFLIFGIRIRSTSFICFVLLTTFTLLVISAWARGLNINCGCFSHHIEYVGLKKVLENVFLILASVFVFFFPDKFLSLDNAIVSGTILNNQSENYQ